MSKSNNSKKRKNTAFEEYMLIYAIAAFSIAGFIVIVGIICMIFDIN